ncbi:unnamed protein product, partial [Cladocopium goreaui]
EFTNFFSGQQQIAGGKLQSWLGSQQMSWCTPYALSIMGEPMVRNCPFGNGNGYGDGRAISVGEVVVKGQRWEMQLKGGGQTPFCRGADGRAVLRSSVREFLASEAMYHLGVDTTRALSLVVSDGGEMAERPWYSDGNRDRDPVVRFSELQEEVFAFKALGFVTVVVWQAEISTTSAWDEEGIDVETQGFKVTTDGALRDLEREVEDMMVHEPCAITCRVAPSFLRVGHVDLFARRATASSATAEQLREHELMLEHALFREYPECSASGSSLPERATAMMRQVSKRFARLISGWLRVGFCQGNFNADNCLVGGRTMDYGPFGWIERYDPSFAKWVGSSMHFAFVNQPQAALANYTTLARSMQPVLTVETLQELVQEAREEMMQSVAAMWRSKLGFEEDDSEEVKAQANALWKQLESLMRFSADFVMLFRLLSDALLLEETDTVSELQPGSMVRLCDLKSAAELNGSYGTCLNFVSSGRWAVATEDGDKSLKPENLEPLQSGQSLFAAIAPAFYDAPNVEVKAKWIAWLRRWKRLRLPGVTPSAVAEKMKMLNPKYVPREWMLVEAYDAASRGDYSITHNLFQLFRRYGCLGPYDEQPESHEKYFRCTPPKYRGKGGVEIMT